MKHGKKERDLKRLFYAFLYEKLQTPYARSRSWTSLENVPLDVFMLFLCAADLKTKSWRKPCDVSSSLAKQPRPFVTREKKNVQNFLLI